MSVASLSSPYFFKSSRESFVVLRFVFSGGADSLSYPGTNNIAFAFFCPSSGTTATFSDSGAAAAAVAGSVTVNSVTSTSVEPRLSGSVMAMNCSAAVSSSSARDTAVRADGPNALPCSTTHTTRWAVSKRPGAKNGLCCAAAAMALLAAAPSASSADPYVGTSAIPRPTCETPHPPPRVAITLFTVSRSAPLSVCGTHASISPAAPVTFEFQQLARSASAVFKTPTNSDASAIDVASCTDIPSSPFFNSSLCDTVITASHTPAADASLRYSSHVDCFLRPSNVNGDITPAIMVAPSGARVAPLNPKNRLFFPCAFFSLAKHRKNATPLFNASPPAHKTRIVLGASLPSGRNTALAALAAFPSIAPSLTSTLFGGKRHRFPARDRSSVTTSALSAQYSAFGSARASANASARAHPRVPTPTTATRSPRAPRGSTSSSDGSAAREDAGRRARTRDGRRLRSSRPRRESSRRSRARGADAPSAAARDENNIAASIERANARSREATRDEMTMTMKMTMLDWRA